MEMNFWKSPSVHTLRIRKVMAIRGYYTLQQLFVLALSLNVLHWSCTHAESQVNETLHVALDGNALRMMWYSDPDELLTEPNSNVDVLLTRSTDVLPECEYLCDRCGLRLPRLVSGLIYSYSADAGGFHGLLYEVVLPEVVPESRAAVQDDGRAWRVEYRCRDESSALWSARHSLLVHGSGSLEVSRSAIGLVADMGAAVESNDTMLSLKTAYSSREFGDLSMLVHGGDISYADDHFRGHNWYIWRKYISKLQPFASEVLYMTGPGNHEAQFNFTAYHNWFHMPYKRSNSTSPDYYSFDYLGVHFAMMSTEMNFSQGSLQYEWLEADLKRANANRDDVPWVIVVGHRPLYCSSITTIHRCVEEAAIYRQNIEDLLNREGVDVYLCGHNHQYERTYPMYRGKAVSFNFTNPTAPVYIVNGGAGNMEGNDATHLPQKLVPWRAAAGNRHTGWMSLIPMESRLCFFYIESKKHKIVDQFEITRSDDKSGDSLSSRAVHFTV